MPPHPHAPPGAETPPRAPRRKSFRPGFTRCPKQWDAAKVGTIIGYPKSPEAYERRRQAASERAIRLNAEGRMTRRGVPDGWSGRKAELAATRAQADLEAKEMIAALRAVDALDLEDIRAEIALEYVLSVVRNPSEAAAARVSAARIALSFLKRRPGVELAVALRTAESVLAALQKAAA